MTNIAILGLGVVGSGTADVLADNAATIAARAGDEINVKYILDLRDFPDSRHGDKVIHDYSVILADPDVKIVVEVMGGCRPAFEFSMGALCAGKHVVTSNKELVAAHGAELSRAAAEHGVRYLFEASVGGGIPILRPLRDDLAANDITEISGILNGTTNYILTAMFKGGRSFADALSEAQRLGYAEKNPSADVDGIDACRKICILCALGFGELPDSSKVHTEGISALTGGDVAAASAAGCALKLIAHARRDGKKITAMVSPRLVPYDNPLSHVDGVYNGILVRGNAIGDVMFYGQGAGKLPTASAVVSDVIDIVARPSEKTALLLPAPDADMAGLDAYACRSCVRFIEPTGKKAVADVFGKVDMIAANTFVTGMLTEKETAAAMEKTHPASRIRIL